MFIGLHSIEDGYSPKNLYVLKVFGKIHLKHVFFFFFKPEVMQVLFAMPDALIIFFLRGRKPLRSIIKILEADCLRFIPTLPFNTSFLCISFSSWAKLSSNMYIYSAMKWDMVCSKYYVSIIILNLSLPLPPPLSLFFTPKKIFSIGK